jgi:hypothetical protein
MVSKTDEMEEGERSKPNLQGVVKEQRTRTALNLVIHGSGLEDVRLEIAMKKGGGRIQTISKTVALVPIAATASRQRGREREREKRKVDEHSRLWVHPDDELVLRLGDLIRLSLGLGIGGGGGGNLERVELGSSEVKRHGHEAFVEG